MGANIWRRFLKSGRYDALNRCDLCVGLHGVILATSKTDELNHCEDSDIGHSGH